MLRKCGVLIKASRQYTYLLWFSDDYNHWMGGVDLADQRIANYHPDIRCHRTWIPIFLQCLSIIRNNMFLIFKQYHDDKNPKKVLKQKEIVLEMVSVLMKKAVDPLSLDISSPLFNSQHQHQFLTVRYVWELEALEHQEQCH